MDTSGVDDAVRRSHEACGAFVRGDPEPLKELFSHREDATIANPFGPAARGWKQVAETMERAATYYKDGEVVGFDPVSRYETPELAYIVEIERYRAKIGGKSAPDPVALRVTSIFRPEDGTWKVMHRHADHITAARPAESVIDG